MKGRRTVLTFDVDWAPDFVIDDVAEMLRLGSVPSTWFVTHPSPAIDRLRQRPDLFELGLHPNFLPGSTHGSSTADVMAYVNAIAPDAISLRSHSLVQSGTLLEYLVLQSSIGVVSNDFLPMAGGLALVPYERGGRTLLKAPFNWADDYAMRVAQPQWTPGRWLGLPGLNVALFHPLNVHLNMSQPRTYDDIKRLGRPFAELTAADLAPLRSDDTEGTRSFLERVIADAERPTTLRRLHSEVLPSR